MKKTEVIAMNTISRIEPINPSCETLIRQLLAYQLKDPDQGRVLKKDDHGPDALIAGMARRAAHHRTLIDQET